MNGLKAMLYSTYVVLTLLLLLSALKLLPSVSKEPESQPVTPSDTITPTPPIPPADTAIVRKARAIGHQGNVTITLLWDFYGDIDLHVGTPVDSREIYYGNQVSQRAGGYLDKDNIPGGQGAAEHVYFTNPPKGRYTVSIVYFSSNGRNRSGGVCTIVVDQKGKPPKVFYHNMNLVHERRHVCSFNVE